MYIAGPMADLPELNFPEFIRVAAHLRQAYPDVSFLSPHEIQQNTKDQLGIMKEDFKALLTCDAIVLIDGWYRSKGAMQELSLARWSGMEVFRYNIAGGLVQA